MLGDKTLTSEIIVKWQSTQCQRRVRHTWVWVLAWPLTAACPWESDLTLLDLSFLSIKCGSCAKWSPKFFLTLKILWVKCCLIFLTASQIHFSGLSGRHLYTGDFLTTVSLHSCLALCQDSNLKSPHLIPSTILSLFLSASRVLFKLSYSSSYDSHFFNQILTAVNSPHVRSSQSHIDNSFENFWFPLAGLISNNLISFSHLEALNGIIARWLLWQESYYPRLLGGNAESILKCISSQCVSPHKYYLTFYDVKVNHWKFLGILSYKIIDCLKIECIISVPNLDF